MPTISIRLNENELREVKKKAAANNQTMNDYILSNILDEYKAKEELTLQEVVKKAMNMKIGEEFTLVSLYPLKKWKEFDSTDKRIVGRTFYKLVNDKESEISKEFKFIGKVSNIAIYKRI